MYSIITQLCIPLLLMAVTCLMIVQVGKVDCVSEADLCASLYIQKPCVAVFKGLGIHNFEIHHGAFKDLTGLSVSWKCHHVISLCLGEVCVVAKTIPFCHFSDLSFAWTACFSFVWNIFKCWYNRRCAYDRNSFSTQWFWRQQPTVLCFVHG